MPGPSRETDTQAAIAAARRRGEETIAKLFDDPGMLTGEEMAKLLGIDRAAVDDMRQARQLLGLDGAKRGIRYPRWQLAGSRPINGLAEILAGFGDQAWSAYRFLTQRHAGLGGKTAIDALKAADPARVLEAARTAQNLDFS